ncbi:MAG: hypothetical protein EOO81_04650, partial [Oxalobacteraceae bacterium]
MDEWLSNPQWWLSNGVSAMIGIMLTAALASLYRRAASFSRRAMEKAKGSIRSAYRASKKKRLGKIKMLRFDSVVLHRRIVFSYAMMILFVVTGISTVLLLLILPLGITTTRIAFIIGIFAAIPALGFEVAWLRASSLVDDVIRFRAR